MAGNRKKCLIDAANNEIPSTGDVPFPNSSIKHNDLAVCECNIFAIWFKSTEKEDNCEDTLSMLDIRENILLHTVEDKNMQDIIRNDNTCSYLTTNYG